MALYHYLKIPPRQRTPATWNNLGVAFDGKQLPANAVLSYREAEAMGESLAMSNLAYKFMDGGFLAEAQKECDAALDVKDYHRNIGLALSRVKEIEENERKKLVEILERAKEVSAFYRLIGKSVTLPEPSDVSGLWQGPDCILVVRLEGNAFTAAGSFERPAVGGILGNSLLGLVGNNNLPPDHFIVEYNGVVRGRTVEGKVMRRKDRKTSHSSLLSEAGTDPKIFLMVLMEDNGKIQVMDSQGGDQRFYYLERKQ